jgi:hypothetical protein
MKKQTYIHVDKLRPSQRASIDYAYSDSLNELIDRHVRTKMKQGCSLRGACQALSEQLFHDMTAGAIRARFLRFQQELGEAGDTES